MEFCDIFQGFQGYEQCFYLLQNTTAPIPDAQKHGVMVLFDYIYRTNVCGTTKRGGLGDRRYRFHTLHLEAYLETARGTITNGMSIGLADPIL